MWAWAWASACVFVHVLCKYVYNLYYYVRYIVIIYIPAMQTNSVIRSTNFSIFHLFLSDFTLKSHWQCVCVWVRVYVIFFEFILLFCFHSVCVCVFLLCITKWMNMKIFGLSENIFAVIVYVCFWWWRWRRLRQQRWQQQQWERQSSKRGTRRDKKNEKIVL